MINIINVIVALAFIGLDSWYDSKTIHDTIKDLFQPQGFKMIVNGKERMVYSNRLPNYTYQVLSQMIKRKTPLIERAFELGRWQYRLTDAGRAKVNRIKFAQMSE